MSTQGGTTLTTTDGKMTPSELLRVANECAEKYEQCVTVALVPVPHLPEKMAYVVSGFCVPPKVATQQHARVRTIPLETDSSGHASTRCVFAVNAASRWVAGF